MNKLVAACAQNPITWKQVGEELIPGSDSDVQAVLNGIQVNSQGNVTLCCSSLFDQWLQRDPDASWELLIKALNIALLNNLATEIEGMLQPSADSTHKTETAKPQIQTGMHNDVHTPQNSVSYYSQLAICLCAICMNIKIKLGGVAL